MKVLLACPLEEDITKKMDEATEKLKDLFPEETFEFVFANPIGKLSLDWLADTVMLLREANLIWFTGNFMESRECEAVFTIAKLYGIPGKMDISNLKLGKE